MLLSRYQRLAGVANLWPNLLTFLMIERRIAPRLEQLVAHKYESQSRYLPCDTMADRLAKLEKVYRRNPDSPLFARLADLYLKRGKTEHALEICLQGCQKFPEYATGFMVLARCYEAGGAVEEARDALDQALRIDPVNPKGYEHLSVIYHKLGVPTLALKTLQQAAMLDPFAEELPPRVDELTYEVRLESTRERDVGEVDPYVTPDQATAGVAASDDPEAVAESVPDEAVEEEAALSGEQDISVSDSESVSEANDVWSGSGVRDGRSVSNDEESDFGVVISEGGENGPSEPGEDEHDGLNEFTAVVGDKEIEPDENDLFVCDDEEVLQEAEGEATLDGRSAETRLAAGPGEGFEGVDWDGAEESPVLDGDDNLPTNRPQATLLRRLGQRSSSWTMRQDVQILRRPTVYLMSRGANRRSICGTGTKLGLQTGKRMNLRKWEKVRSTDMRGVVV